MTSSPISVKEAITRGIEMVKIPARRIFIGTFLLVALIWFFFGFAWWVLLLIPLGMFIAKKIANRARTKWRFWAYSNVADIHQLQRSAELAELLSTGSHKYVGDGLMFYQRQEMSLLLERFSQDCGFIDDPAIPDRTDIYERPLIPIGSQPILSLDSLGISAYKKYVLGWEEIENERIANVGFIGRHRYDGSDVSAGTLRYFRFNWGTRQFEFKLEDIKIPAWELDLLTYIYRGRWRANQIKSYNISTSQPPLL